VHYYNTNYGPHSDFLRRHGQSIVSVIEHHRSEKRKKEGELKIEKRKKSWG
jgi:hypothetical protein